MTTANLLVAAWLLNSPKRGSDTHGALGQIVQGPQVNDLLYRALLLCIANCLQLLMKQ